MHAELPTGFRSPELLQADASRLLIVDVQEKLVRVMPQAERLISACRMLMSGAELFGVPVFVTEQYPEGLGPTVAELAGASARKAVKQEFSSWRCLQWPTAAEDAQHRFQVVVAGVEAHVCVLQTALELQSAGYRVFVVADAVASRREADRQTALDRLLSAGVTPVAAESVLFEWCERANRPEFKALSQLVKSRPV